MNDSTKAAGEKLRVLQERVGPVVQLGQLPPEPDMQGNLTDVLREQLKSWVATLTPERNQRTGKFRRKVDEHERVAVALRFGVTPTQVTNFLYNMNQRNTNDDGSIKETRPYTRKR